MESPPRGRAGLVVSMNLSVADTCSGDPSAITAAAIILVAPIS